MSILKNKTRWLIFGALLITSFGQNIFAREEQNPLTVYVFWAEGCPHCDRAIRFTQKWAREAPYVQIHYLELTREPNNQRIFRTLIHYFGIQRPGVPLTVIGEHFFQGFGDDSTTGEAIKSAAKGCLSSSCKDIVQLLLLNKSWEGRIEFMNDASQLPRVLNLSVCGEISLADVSLPALTIMQDAGDGFNPCAILTLL